MRGYIANTDWDWFSFLSAQPVLEEVNFWRPSGRINSVSLQPGEPFFFKLKAPRNAIGGFGYFARYSNAPLWYAWESFDVRNGAPNFESMRVQIKRYRADQRPDPGGLAVIGCRMISNPAFFQPGDWVRIPADWSGNIVGGKGYDLERGEGERVYRECLERVAMEDRGRSADLRRHPEAAIAKETMEKYGRPQLVRPRLGQGTFRMAVTDAYGCACAVTTEHSLPVLDVAHIMPFAEDGEHEISNGLLLRTDIHRLFDRGYVTVTSDLKFEVSHKLKDDYANGKTYYAYQGRPLLLPSNPAERPSLEYLSWHHSNRFRG